MQMRWMRPDQAVPLYVDASVTGFTQPVQVNGACSVVVKPSMGTVGVQVNNANQYLVRSDYGIGLSPDALQSPRPVLNPSFSAQWASVTGLGLPNNAGRNQFLNVNVEGRYIRFTSTALSSVTRATLFGYVFRRPRI